MDYHEEIRLLYLMQHTYATLFSVTNRLQIQGDKYLEKLTSRQFMTIMAILHLPEDETTLNNIAKKMGTTKQNVNTLIGSIEQKGYLFTFPSLRDRRAVNISITDSGKQVMLECNEKGLDFFADVFAGFTQEELETLLGLLKKLSGGENRDGFEGDISGKVQTSDEYRKRQLERFSKRRKRAGMAGKNGVENNGNGKT